MLLASRFPAVRRPQQLHNVALALATMQKAGLSLQVSLTSCFFMMHVCQPMRQAVLPLQTDLFSACSKSSCVSSWAGTGYHNGAWSPVPIMNSLTGSVNYGVLKAYDISWPVAPKGLLNGCSLNSAIQAGNGYIFGR